MASRHMLSSIYLKRDNDLSYLPRINWNHKFHYAENGCVQDENRKWGDLEKVGIFLKTKTFVVRRQFQNVLALPRNLICFHA